LLETLILHISQDLAINNDSVGNIVFISSNFKHIYLHVYTRNGLQLTGFQSNFVTL